MMTMVPQFLLSGLFFPLYSMPWGVRWIGYLLPLTWFIKVARGVMVRGAPIGALWLPLVDPGGDGRRRLHRLHAALPPRPRAGRRPEGTDSGGPPRGGARGRRTPTAARDGVVSAATTSAWGVRDLTVRYGRRTALDGVSLEVPGGAVTAVVGGGRRRQDDAAARARRRGPAGDRERAPAGPAPDRLRGRRLRPLRRPQRRRERRLRRRRLRPHRAGARRADRSACWRRPASPAPARASPAGSPAACGRSWPSRSRCCTSRSC